MFGLTRRPCLQVLQGDHPAPLPDNMQPSAAGAAAMLEVFTIQQQYWSNLSEATFLKLGALLMKLTKDMSRKRILKRRHTGGPVWWKWGRRRVLYDIWLRTKMKHHSDDHTHDHHCCAFWYCRIKVTLNLPFQLSSFGKIVILEMKRQIFGSLELRILYNHPVVVYLFIFPSRERHVTQKRFRAIKGLTLSSWRSRTGTNLIVFACSFED